MKMSSSTRLINGCLLLLLSLKSSLAEFEPGPVLGKFYNPRPPTEIQINKVSLTQNGYIQVNKANYCSTTSKRARKTMLTLTNLSFFVQGTQKKVLKPSWIFFHICLAAIRVAFLYF